MAGCRRRWRPAVEAATGSGCRDGRLPEDWRRRLAVGAAVVDCRRRQRSMQVGWPVNSHIGLVLRLVVGNLLNK